MVPDILKDHSSLIFTIAIVEVKKYSEQIYF
jgi:hypothetical protein